ncbi:hypothetical protein [Anatilimnocola floriformis]|uniref:hypothetical protein n=1 Tax=Anatilimnocola floriformis TaxID=2948575 RepID=UPI0020C4BF3C|nr:hypothetical protein [Anatilimnocola floriformis]
MGMRTAGPACCCCEHFIRGNEISSFMMPGGGLSGTFIDEKPDKPTDQRVRVNQLITPGGDSLSVHTIAPDWSNKRLYYAYSTRVRDSGGTMIDMKSTFKWWDTKDAGPGTAVAEVNSLICDALAASPDEEKIYWAARAYVDGAFPNLSSNYGIDLRRMNYDGTNQANLATVNVYRTGSIATAGKLGSMLVNRKENRLYYVVRQNVTTSTAADWVWEIRYRDLGTFAESTIYSVTGAQTTSGLGSSVIHLLNCLSFDLADGKIYWCEHYLTASSRQEGKVRRANLDGSSVELLYQSADPYAVNFARYSNKLGLIVHGDKDRTGNVLTPKNGVWLRDKANWSTAEQIATEGAPETLNFDATSSFLWCGFEGSSA